MAESTRTRIHETEYESGHMMYLHEPSLAKLKRDIGVFIDQTSQAGTPAEVVQ